MPVLHRRSTALTAAVCAAAGIAGGIVGASAAHGEGVSGNNVTAAAAYAPMRGLDVSWPQCPPGVGRGGGQAVQSAAFTTQQFVVIGVNQGSPFNANPCVKSLVENAKARHLWVAGYTMTSPPNNAEYRRYAAAGPYTSATRTGRLRNNGYAQARWTVAYMHSQGFFPTFMWLDVEPIKLRTWSTTPAGQATARAILKGMQSGFAKSGIRTGFYSYKYGWKEITGGMRSTSPVWATAGRTSWAKASAKCSAPSFSGGPVVMSQWFTDYFDYDMTCPAMASKGGLSRYFTRY